MSEHEPPQSPQGADPAPPPSTSPLYPNPVAYPMTMTPSGARHRPGPAPGLEYAGFAWRVLGFVMDNIILFAINAPLTIPLVYVPFAQFYRDHPTMAGHSAATLPSSLATRFVLVGILGAVISAVYFGGLVAWKGRTLGQRAMGTMVVREEDGGPLPVDRALLRSVIFWGPDALAAVPTLGFIAFLVKVLGLVSAAWDPRRQGWHDKAARALVVKTVAL